MSSVEGADLPPDELMAQVVLRLHCAALLAWRHSEDADPTSPLQGLGLGIYLARGTAAQLLPHELQVDELEDTDASDHHCQRGVIELLTDAESLLSSRADLVFSELAVELCDLIREARAYGC